MASNHLLRVENCSSSKVQGCNVYSMVHCVYIYMYTYASKCKYIRTHTRMNLYMHMYIYIHICISICRYLHVQFYRGCGEAGIAIRLPDHGQAN